MDKKRIDLMVSEAKNYHPLLFKNRTFCLDYPWPEFLDDFANEKRPQRLANILFIGFSTSVKENQDLERICFYLRTAFGYRSSDFFSRSNECRVKHFMGKSFRYATDVRNLVAQRAWEMLCQEVFKNSKDSDPPIYAFPSWWDIVKDGEHNVLSEILAFFAFPDNIPLSPAGGNWSHNEIITRKFIVTLSRYGWLHHHSSRGDLILPAQHFVSSRPQLIRLLWYLDELDFLRKNWQEMTDADIKCLGELALLPEKYKYGIDKPHASIRAAALAGSQAADIYLLIQHYREEQAIQDKRQDAKQRLEEAKQDLTRLGPR